MSNWAVIFTLVISATLVVGDKLQKRNFHVDSRFRVKGPTVQPHEAHKFRYQVALQRNCGQICGGTVISDRLVITAAHCVLNTDPKKLVVKAGVTDLNSPGQIVDVFSYITHERFSWGALTNDVALLILQGRLDLSRLTAAIFPHIGEKFIGAIADVSGWGGQSQNLTYTTMKVVESATCKQGPRICLEPATGTEPYFGDSGGPLVLRIGRRVILIGVVSGIIRDEFVFADVATLRPWIDQAVVKAREIIEAIDRNVQRLTSNNCR